MAFTATGFVVCTGLFQLVLHGTHEFADCITYQLNLKENDKLLLSCKFYIHGNSGFYFEGAENAAIAVGATPHVQLMKEILHHLGCLKTYK